MIGIGLGISLFIKNKGGAIAAWLWGDNNTWLFNNANTWTWGT